VVMGEQRTDWSAAKKMLSRPDLLEKMLSIASKDAIDASTLTALHGYIEMPGFAPEQVANVSKAAHNLCLWIHGVYKHQVVVAAERGTPLVLSPTVALAGKAGIAGGAGAASSKDRSSKDRPVKDRSSHDRPTTATAPRSRPTTASARISTVGLVGKARIAAGAGAASPSLPVTPAKRVAGDRADDDHIATREIGDVGLTKADMKDIKELRSMARPPEKVALVMEALCVVMGEQRTDWSAAKKMLSRPDLLEKMLSIASKDAIDASTLTALHGYIEMPGFAPEQVANVSKAAHNLCLWIHGVYKHQVVVAAERGTPLVLSPTVALAGKAGIAGGAGAASSKDRSSKDRPVKDRSSHDRPTTATAPRSRPTTASARIRTNDLCNTPSNTSKGTTRKLHDSPETRLLLMDNDKLRSDMAGMQLAFDVVKEKMETQVTLLDAEILRVNAELAQKVGEAAIEALRVDEEMRLKDLQIAALMSSQAKSDELETVEGVNS